jgi:HEAT repeat protein
VTDANDVRERLSDSEPEVRRRATQDIARLAAPESCDLLLVALGDEDWRVRKEAASVAARIEPRTAVVFALARALDEHDNVGLRNAAVEAMSLIGPDAVPGAIDALERLDPDGRKLAVEVLAAAPTLAGMRALSRGLRDDDANVVMAAAEGLGRAHLAGEEARDLAVRALTSVLGSAATSVCLSALEALRALDADVPWERLEPLFGDPLLRRSAIAAAAGTRTPRAIRALAEACADARPSCSREAVVALGRSIEEIWEDDDLLEIPGKTLRASAAAHARLRDLSKDASDEVARGAAILALGLVRDPADVTLLADALADDAVADRAEAALHLFGQEAIEPLLSAGRTAAPWLRGATISMVPQLAPEGHSPLAAVREALSDPSSDVIAPALKSLAVVGGPGDLERVACHVESPDPRVSGVAQAALMAIAARHPDDARRAIVGTDPRGEHALRAVVVLEALARAGASHPADGELLSSALTHREASVRRRAIDALAAMGGDAAAQAVTFSLADEEDMVAHAAIRALGKLGRAEQLAVLAATTRNPIRLGAVLRALGDADPARAFAAGRPLLNAPEVSVATAAVEVCAAIEGDARFEALMDAAQHADHEVVKLALARLASTADERALIALARGIEHPAEAVRRHAAELLGQQASPDAEGMLRARLDRERSAETRRAIMEALSARVGEAHS